MELKVWGLGLNFVCTLCSAWVEHLGFKVWGLRVRVQGLGLRVWGEGFGV